ncbi:hypothetical protein A0J61_08538 [Choanephora cucurbitarum]|uniref:Uncharacterized protein n=1 Tax=Choanephora cucurbitarum TaxID=101091 RepID=A0A1C7N2U1_9FUNG|nr:hypothetical protein A0J61_08538 [Choanephora cucurbitarum]
MLQCKISIHPISVEHATLEQTDNSKHVPDSKEPKCIWYEDYEQKGDRSSHSYPSCLSLSLSQPPVMRNILYVAVFTFFVAYVSAKENPCPPGHKHDFHGKC